jgi:phage terminase large subunit-like protein
VYLPREAMGQEVIEECSSFPNGKNDDDVDAMTQAISKMIYNTGKIQGKPKHDLYDDYTDEMTRW